MRSCIHLHTFVRLLLVSLSEWGVAAVMIHAQLLETKKGGQQRSTDRQTDLQEEN